MGKILFKNKEQFYTYVQSNTGLFPPPEGRVVSHLDEPDKYPCVGLINYVTDYYGPNYLEGEFVYLDDFENEENI